MASWILVPCLVGLRNEFNALAPGRDKASDGSIGDTAHSQSSSDHNPDETGATPYEDADSTNEVHAVDVDANLRKSGWSMTRAVQIVVLRHRNGQDDRLQNVIYNRVIWSRSWGWTAREYTGSNAHTQHAHFSARYTTAEERDTRPWGLLAAAEKEDEMTPAEMDQLVGKIWQATPWNADYTAAIALQRSYTTTATIDAKVNQLLASVAGSGQVDETALARALVPILNAQLIPAVTAGVLAELGDSSGLTEAEIEAATWRASERALQEVIGRLDDVNA